MGGELDGAVKVGSDAAGHLRPARRQGRGQVRAAGHGLGDRDRRRPDRLAPASARTSTSTSRRWSRSPTSSTGGGNASIGVDSPGGYASGSIDLGQAIGIKKNLTSGKPNSGDITAYYRSSGKLAGEGGLLVGEGAGGALAGDQTLAVTFSADGKPKALTLTATGSYEGKLQLGGKFKDLQTALGAVNGLDIKASQGEGQKIQFQLDLPLDNPDVQNATLAFLRGINPVTGGPADTAAAAARSSRTRSCSNAKAQVRTYDTNSTDGGRQHRPRRGRRRRELRAQRTRT